MLDKNEKKFTGILIDFITNLKNIFRYTAPFDLYASGWSCRSDPHLKFRLALGSFIEEYNNKVTLNFIIY